jgi:WD repeat-containing protein 35
MCEAAVEAYIKVGDVKKAIDCCILLNQWNQAVELAEQHNFG